MKNITHHTKINWKKYLGAVTVGATAIAPVFAADFAQAAPGDWNYRSGNTRDDNREYRTLEGIVSNDQAGRQFVLRLDGGQRITVRSDEREPQRLSDGDRVRVYGFFQRDNRNDRDDNRYDNSFVFRATSVRIVRNEGRNDNDNREYRTLEGIVSNDRVGNSFVLRLDGGQRITVRTDNEPARLSRGDRVRVYGFFQRNNRNDRDNNRYDNSFVFRASSVRVVRNQGRNDNDDFNGRRSVTGIVTDVKSDQRFSFRAANGREFDVYSPSRLPGNLDRGDQVRVYGDVRNDEINNASVVVTDNNFDDGRGPGNSGSFNVNFAATVLVASQNNRTARVRSDSGREYIVRADDDEIDNLRRGDRVRIRGRMQNGVIFADDIDEI